MLASPQWVFDRFRLDPDHACLWCDAQAMVLPPKAFAVLHYLVTHPDRLITKDELLDAVWPETAVSDAVVRVAIGTLRKVLGDTAQTPRFIATVPRRGYRFVAPVAPLDLPGVAIRAERVERLAREVLGEAVTVNLSAAKVVSMSKGMFGPLSPNQDNRAYDLLGIWQPVKLVVRGLLKIEDVAFVPHVGLATPRGNELSRYSVSPSHGAGGPVHRNEVRGRCLRTAWLLQQTSRRVGG